MPSQEPETRTYTLTATPEILAMIERLFALMWICGAWGSSRNFSMWFDGDGRDRLKVEEPKGIVDTYRAGVGKAVEGGYDTISVNDGFYCITSGSDEKVRRHYKDDGTELEVKEDRAL